VRVEPPERMVQLLQDLADEFADFAQGMVRGNPLLRMNVRKHPALILRSSAHLQSSRRIRGGLNHHSFALARFFSKLLETFFVGFCVALGDIEGKPFSVSKIAAYLHMPRTTVAPAQTTGKLGYRLSSQSPLSRARHHAE